MLHVLKEVVSLPRQTTKKCSYMETIRLKKQPVHYRVAYCNDIFPTLTSAKKYVYINYTPQDHPWMHDTYITGHSVDGEPVTFTRVVSSRFVFKFERTFGLCATRL